MKKKVFRERYNTPEEIDELITNLKPVIEKVVETKKYQKPRLAKSLKKKSDNK